MNDIGQSIRKERNRRSWTQKYVAQAIGTTEQNVSRWERGQTVPDTYYRQKLSELFGLSAEEFGFFSDEKKEAPKVDISQGREGEERTNPPPAAPSQASLLLKHRWLLIALAVFLILSLSLIATNVIFLVKNSQSSPAPVTNSAEQEHDSSKDKADGWSKDGHILDLKTSTDIVRGSSPTLRVILSSRDAHDFPVIRRLLSPRDNVHAGQTIRTDVYVPKGEGTIRAWMYAMDMKYQWWQNQTVEEAPQGIWYSISYTIPASFYNTAIQVGIQFKSEPLNRERTVYISSLSWSS